MGVGFFARRRFEFKIAICRWHIAATSSKTGGFLYFPPGKMQTNLRRVSDLSN